jgi:uncharacterized HAD superfamily protein
MIVLDIDGVVSNTYEHLMLDEIGHYTPDALGIKNAKPFEDAWYWVNHYSSIYDIMFVTNRDKKFTNVTWEWFREWDIPVDFVVFEDDIVEFLSQMNPTIYVNDSCALIEDALSANINAFLVDRPYNKNDDSSIDRIFSLWDIKCV